MPGWIPFTLMTAAYLLLSTCDSMWSSPVAEADDKTGETWVTYEHRWTPKRMRFIRGTAAAAFLAGLICYAIP